MMKYMEYLTDTELESLIQGIEQKELIPAHPELRNQILEAVDQEEKALEGRKAGDKAIEYKRYRFRVLITVAAAVLAIFVVPNPESLQRREIEFVKPIAKHEFTMQSHYKTKEEALSDSGMLQTMLGGVNIFADNSRWNLFRE